MKRIQVTVPWRSGLHLRMAAQLVRLTQRFTSRVALHLGNRMADTRSVLGLVLLSAHPGTALEVVAHGVDEHEAVVAVEEFFRLGDGDDPNDDTVGDGPSMDGPRPV